MQQHLVNYIDKESKRTGKKPTAIKQEISELAKVSRQAVKFWSENDSPILITTDTEHNITRISHEPAIKVYFERRS